MVEYDTPMKGQRYIQETKAQILEDIRALVWDKLNKSKGPNFLTPQGLALIEGIVIDNFKKLED